MDEEYQKYEKLFMEAVQGSNFEEAIRCLDSLYKVAPDDFHRVDCNRYLFLLSFITDLPDNYKELARTLTLKQMTVSSGDIRFEKNDLYNHVVEAIYLQSFGPAKNNLDSYVKNFAKNSTGNEILNELLNCVIAKVNDRGKDMLGFIENRDIVQLRDYLLSEQGMHNLSRFNLYLLKMANEYIEISSLRKVPACEGGSFRNTFAAIDAKDYLRALEICRNRTGGNKKLNRIMRCMLECMCELLHNIKLETAVSSDTINFNDFINYFRRLLIAGEKDRALEILDKYMISVNIHDFYSVVASLVEISVLEGDRAFIKPITLLESLNNNYSFSLIEYFIYCYTALKIGRSDIAEMYLSVISNINAFIGSVENIIDLLSLLQGMKPGKKIMPEKSFFALLFNDFSEMRLVDMPQATFVDKCVDEALVYRKHMQLVDNKGIVLLKEMSSERIERITERVAKNYSDIDAYVITFENKEYLVLRYVESLNLNTSDDEAIAFSLYKKEEFAECIPFFLKALQGTNRPRASIFAHLGLAYKNCGNFVGIDYLIVATAIGKRDYSDLIHTLNSGQLYKDADYKPEVVSGMNKVDFFDNGYCLSEERMTAVVQYAIDNSLDIQTASYSLGLTDDEMLCVQLACAEQYFFQGNRTEGEKFLNFVRKFSKGNSAVCDALMKFEGRRKLRKPALQIRVPRKLYSVGK